MNKHGYTGASLRVRLDDLRYGGPQFVTKLYTEGLGRGPSAEEYKAMVQRIEAQGCTVETLRALAAELFAGDEFVLLQPSRPMAAAAVYRAMLNRDASLEEIEGFTKGEGNAASLAQCLANGEEFAALLPAMNEGPYYWGVNQAFSPVGAPVLTSAQVQEMLNDKSVQILELEQGTVVLVTDGIRVPDGKTLTTKGAPAHYLLQARFLRAELNGNVMVSVGENAVLSHVWVDGNRLAFADKDTPPRGGTNIVAVGNGARVTHCRTNGTASGTHLVGNDFARRVRITHNLVTCYETSHTKAWADGITHASADGVIEYNTVIDATDVGIIVFRFVSKKGEGDNQNTVVRHNTVINAGNSAYAGLDIDSWFEQKKDQYFRGALFEDNALWTSFRAHQHICLSLAPLAWTSSIGDHAYGTDMVNNYTPDGLQVLCAAAVAVDGVHECKVRHNRLRVFIGDWGRSYDDPVLDIRLTSFNSQTSDGDFQGEFEDKPMFLPMLPFIYPHPQEPYGDIVLQEAFVWEE